MKRAFCLAILVLLIVPSTALSARKGASLTVTPLEDEFGGQSAPLYTPPGPVVLPDGPVPSPGDGNMDTGGVAVEKPARPQADPGLIPGSNGKDPLVMAYLIELARKQGKPCPSGVDLPVPPSLAFSEPLCKAAQAIMQGEEPRQAMEGSGFHLGKWRMFSAPNIPAQQVVNGLRQSHCEALLEPYTHIGAYRGPQGWRILLATIGNGENMNPILPESIQREPGPPPTPGELPDEPPAQGSLEAATSSPGTSAFTTPESGAGDVISPDGTELQERPGTSGASGQEARAMFLLLNDLRAKGGVCLGKEVPIAPALLFDPALQAVAEADVQKAVAEGGFQASLGSSSSAAYQGGNVTRLALKAGVQPTVALDVWAVNPSQCESLFSPMFTDVGIAYTDGYWVVILGGKNQGVPSDK